MKKKDIAGSVGTGVAAVVEEDSTIYNAAAIDYKIKANISGKVAGIQIRGKSSNAGNYRNGWYVVDGIIISEDQIKTISTSDFISIDVLKGEKASALYGSKAANGVIIITTTWLPQLFKKKHFYVFKQLKNNWIHFFIF